MPCTSIPWRGDRSRLRAGRRALQHGKGKVLELVDELFEDEQRGPPQRAKPRSRKASR